MAIRRFAVLAVIALIGAACGQEPSGLAGDGARPMGDRADVSELGATTGTFKVHELKVFFTDGDAVVSGDCAGVVRFMRKTKGPDVLHDSLNALLRGPTKSEQAAGATSFLSRRTAGMLNSVRITEGVTYVDFDDLRNIIPNASTSCGSAALLAQLNKTARQFPAVTDIVYSFEGNEAAFYEWLQMSPPVL